jgi:gliding motility-associated-like protein
LKKLYYISVVSWITLCFSLSQTYGQQQVAKISAAGRGYYEFLPADYETSPPDKKYPCIIFLHGHGERGNGKDQITRVLAQGIPKFIKNGAKMCFTVNGVNECFIVLSPQQTENRNGWTNDANPFIRWAISYYTKIDPNRVYITGLSMGGDGTWGSSYEDGNNPNMFAAMVPVSCKGDYKGAMITAARGIPVWAFHGDKDTSVPLKDGQRPINGMNDAKANPAPIMTIIEGGTHSGSTWDKVYSPTNTYYSPNIYEWFLSHSLAPATPKPPVVNAGSTIEIQAPVSTAKLNGTVSDPDSPTPAVVWTQVSGPNNATIATPTAISTNLSNLIVGTYTFRITATDNTNLTASAQVTVKVNPAPPPVPPVANAGVNHSITLPTNSVTINGSGTDSDGTIISYAWTQTNGPSTATLSGQSTQTLSVSNLIVGTYIFTLTVTDNTNLTGSAQVSVVVKPEPPNNPPTANAGIDRSITLPLNTITLTGSGSDTDGTISSYAWSQFNGPSIATLQNESTTSVTISDLIEGVYTFELAVTDNRGAKSTDIVVVTVLPIPPNTPPVANAGSDKEVTLPTNEITLTGSGSDADNDEITYLWTQESGPNTAVIATNNTANTLVSSLVEGNYVFTLTVTDSKELSHSDQVLVKVLPVPPNEPPIANAGNDRQLTLPNNTITLSGTHSPSEKTVTYEWIQESGPSASTIVSPNNAETVVSGLVEGVYIFDLTVTDALGAQGSDQIVVTVFAAVNQPPIVTAGPNQSITLPTNSVTVVGSATDEDGSIAEYSWEQVSGPNTALIASPHTSTTVINNLTSGIYIFSLTATDNDLAKSSVQVTITVLPEPPNQPPVANAGSNQTLILPENSTTLTGSGTDSDGSIVSYSWRFVNGPGTGSTSSTSSPTLDLWDLTEGIYVFEFTVTDNRGASASAEVKVFVNSENEPPTANAGPDQTITLPTNTVTLTGAATDPDGDVNDLTYFWLQVSGPSNAVITSPDEKNTTVTGLVEGIYTFSFRATDLNGDIDTDQITVTVNPALPNTPPVANAGGNKEITLPTNSITLSGSGTDSDGTIVSYAWSQISGPSNATSNANNNASVTYSNLIDGTYVFRLTVTDNQGAKGQQNVSVKVNPQPVNLPPVVEAGNNQQITLPTNQITLSGTATDPEGNAMTYAWSQINGSSVASINASGSLQTLVSNLVEGIYVFRLTATDNQNVSSFDEVSITVHPIPFNLPPIANAGGNRVITLPTTSVLLEGNGTDPEGGAIEGYLWSQISGPNNATTTPLTSQNITLSNLIEGIYVFRLTVTDAEGSTGFDEINVRVQPVPANHPPTAHAGTNQIITLPTNQVTFLGNGTDPENTPITYSWTQIDGPSTVLPQPHTAQSLTATNLIEGTYIFRLTVKDGAGLEGFDEINVRVNPEPPNVAPTVSAGSNITITLPTNSATVTGTASDSDGTITTYSWTKVSGPSATMVDADKAILKLSNLVEGAYVFRLTVTDNDGASIYAEVNVVVNPIPANNPPVITVPDNVNVIIPPTSITLTATATDDFGISSTVWEQVSGPVATISNAASLTATISNLQAGNYTFRFSATDNTNNTSFAETQIKVYNNLNPVAFVGTNPLQVFLPTNTVSLVGAGSDPDGTIASYSWSFVNGPNTLTVPANQKNITLNGLIAGTYTLRLTVTDNLNATANANLTINVLQQNLPPVANAGGNQNVTLPVTELELNGLLSEDPDGSITSYVWEQTSGPAVELLDETFAIARVEDIVAGTYQFKLTVTDNAGVSDSDVVTVTVNPKVNTPPTANAGIDLQIKLPVNTVTLKGIATDDGGSTLHYHWQQDSGPHQTIITVSNTDPTEVSVIFPAEGIYRFKFVVTDEEGLTGEDEVTVTVLPVDNKAPTVDAGSDIVVQLPLDEITLQGIANDEDGTLTRIEWKQVSGPNQATFTASTSLVTQVSNLIQGIYSFELTVEDDAGATASDNITVEVKPALFPKVFSTNNSDPAKNKWRWPNTDEYQGCLLTIYNRFGLKIFEMRSYDNSWDGTYQGKALEAEAYYYVIDCGDGRQITGGVRIVR